MFQDGIILIPVLAEEDVEEIPASFSVVPILDMRSSRRADQITLARIIDKWLCYKKPDLRFSRVSEFYLQSHAVEFCIDSV